METLYIDDFGFVWLDNFKVCRITNQGDIEFFDRDRRRAERRGSAYIYISSTDLANFLLRITREVRWMKHKEQLQR